MVSSTLNPQVINKSSKVSLDSFGNFMTGGNLSSNSTITTAANKIVNFNRPNVEVISAINTLQNTAENIQVRAESILQNTIKSFTQDYNTKVKSFDDNRPNNVLSKFLELYKNAIGFVNFFGDRKNIDIVSKNLKSLRKIFEESLEVAFVIRQTIIKIVKQLSNLPTASPNSSGLDLDINIPKGKLGQTAGPKVRNVGRLGGRHALLGAGLLGLGGLAGSGIEKARQYQEGLLAEGVGTTRETQYIPENIVESFSAIVDRFASAVNSLISGAKRSGDTGGGGSSSGGGGGGSSGNASGTNGSGAISGTPEQKALLDTISFAEGTQKSYGTISGGDVNKDLEQGKLTVKEVIELGNTYGTPGSKHKWSGATGRYQFMPNTLKNLINKGVLNPDEPFTPQKQDEAALWLAYNRGVSAEMLAKEGLSANVANKLSPEWASFPTLSGRSYYGQSVKSLTDIQKMYSKSLQSPQTSPIQTPQVSPAPIASQATQSTAQNIFQPAQQIPQTISLPPTVVDMSGPATQSSNRGQISTPQSPHTGSPEVPFYPTTNPDNFLTMYSRIVYNIIDG